MEISKEKQILNSAAEVFALRGFHESTIAEIASNAEIATGLIYEKFINKHDLLLSLTLDFWRNFNELVQNEIKKELEPKAQIKIILNCLENILFENIYLAKILTEALPIIIDSSKLRIKKEKKEGDFQILKTKRESITHENRKFLNSLDEIIKRGQYQGSFDNTLNPAILRQILYGSVEMILYGLYLGSVRKENVGYNINDARVGLKKLVEKL